MQQQLLKAINLAKKTGDKLIVFDGQYPESIYVVMSLAEYEKMILQSSDVRGLTEQELLDKINRDIAIWKSEQDWLGEEVKKERDYFFNPNLKLEKERVDSVLSEVRDRFIPPGLTNEDGNMAETGKKCKSFWEIPPERKQAAEEIIEEDRQYLEDITF